MNQLKKFRKTSFMAFSMVLAVTLLVSAFAFLAAPTDSPADGGDVIVQRNARQLLDQFWGRRFPNERPPRDDLVAAKAAGIPMGASRAEADAMLKDWYSNFYAKKEKSGPNPMAFAERMRAMANAEAQGKSVEATDAISGVAKLLMIPIEFAGTDNIAGCDTLGGSQTFTATVTGPLFGTIPDPSLEGDNNTIYAPNGNFDIPWYEDMFFGNGVGVVRTDLNGGAGVDLTGVTASKWYEEQSEGKYSLSGEVYSPTITLDHSVAWYGWDGDETDPLGRGVPCNGTPSGWGFEFVRDAINKLSQDDPNFDWSQYDVHGPSDQGGPDGIVDHLVIIHAGVDNSAGGGTYGNYQLWAHSWDVYCDNNNDGDIFDAGDYGCLVQGSDTVTTTDDIYVGNYTHVPEDADIGVVVHEFGHDIGLPDYYDQTGTTSNSTAHWIVMSGGSWSGALGGSHPAPFNPWARWFFGWETPTVVSYTTAGTTVMLGQSEPTPANTVDSVKIELPDQAVAVDNRAGTGKGLHSVLGNMLESSLNKTFDLSNATAPVFTFDTFFDLEQDWDYTYVRASTDGGQTWDILLNNEGAYATTDPNGSFAYKGPGGLTGLYDAPLTYDLSAYAGQSAVTLEFLYVTDQAVQNAGIWLDNFSLDDGGNNLYANNLEDASDWTFSTSEWEVVPYNILYPNYYILEWRNKTGSIAQQGQLQQYYSLAITQTGWMVDKFSANVPGMVVWYRNDKYDNNQAVAGGREFDPPATGPKGQLLAVDSHNDAIPWGGGWWDAGQLSNRRGAMDAAFGLDPVPAWMIHDNAVATDTLMNFGGRPAVSEFNDALRSVPGWVYPGDGFVYRADRSASVVIPAEGDYTTRIRSLDGNGNPGADLTGFWGFTVGGQRLGSGNPGDSGVQFGVHAQVITQAVDGTWGKIKIWNAKAATSVSPPPAPITAPGTYSQTYYANVQNTGGGPITTTVTIAVPDQVSVQSVTPAGYTTTKVAAQTYVWQDYMIAAGQSVTFEVDSSYTSNAGDPPVDLTGQISVDDGTGQGTDTFDVSTSASLVQPNLGVMGPSFVAGRIGELVTFTLVMSNSGDTPDDFDLTGSNGSGWVAGVTPPVDNPGDLGTGTFGSNGTGSLGTGQFSQTVHLNPGQTKYALIGVVISTTTVPKTGGAIPGVTADTNVTLTAQSDPSKSASTTVTAGVNSIAFKTPTDLAVVRGAITDTRVAIEVDIPAFFNVPTDGHWHLQVDGQAWPGTPVMTYTYAVTLTQGSHTFTATLVDSGHQPVGPTDTITILVSKAELYLPLVMKAF